MLALLLLCCLVTAAEPDAQPHTVLQADHEFIVHSGGDTSVLPTWRLGQRRLFDLEDILRVTRPLTLHKDNMLRVVSHGHRLDVQRGSRFLRLDGRAIPLDGPLPTSTQTLLDLRILDSLFSCGMLSGVMDYQSESMSVQSAKLGLRREILPGGEILRLQFDEIPVFESDPEDNDLQLMLPAGSGLSLWGRDNLDSICEGGLLKRIRVSQSRDIESLEFRWESEAEFFELVELESLSEVQLVLRQPGRQNYAAQFEVQEAPRIQEALKAIELDLIMIDPGHGGKDPGAVSPRGRYEKDFTLALALALREELQHKLPGVEVMLTREDDRFISLGARTEMANRMGAKLFVSLHANAAKDRRARGWEVYFLRTGRNQHAREVALKENAVLALEEQPSSTSPENWIFATMAQSAYARESETLAALMADELEGLGHTRKRRVLQAGFHVLVGASMPAVLVEAGFLTNRKDESMLYSAEGQARFARELADSIVRFRDLHAR